MGSIVLPSLVACLLTVVLTPLVRKTSIALGWVDVPDQRRKLHHTAVPRTGGVAIMASYVAAFGALFALPAGSAVLAPHLTQILALLPPVVLIFGIGLLDDVRNLKPSHKLVGQVLASLWMYAAGVRVVAAHGPVLSCIVTVGWLVLCSNAFNLIDGVDGLAAGVGLTATLTTFIAGVLHGDVLLALATAPLAGCLLGFLRYNFNPASIFLGDSGSLSVGFLLGAYAVIWSQKSATLAGIAAPAVALALPLLEVGLSIVRRFLRSEPITVADRGHIHHRLLDRGFTPRRVAILLYGAGGIAATLSLLQSVVRGWMGGIVVLLVAACIAGGVRYLRYAEFHAARLFIDGWRAILRAHVHLELLRRSFEAATNVEECWNAIARTGQALGYPQIRARLAGVSFTTPEWGGGVEEWQMRMNLERGDYVNITQLQTSPQRPMLLAGFASAIRATLPRRLAAFHPLPISEASLEKLANALEVVLEREHDCPEFLEEVDRTREVNTQLSGIELNTGRQIRESAA